MRPPGYWPSPYDTVSHDDLHSFSTTPVDTGNLTILRRQTEQDATGRITRYRVLGTFRFQARNARGQKVQVTEGLFYRDNLND